MILKNKQYISSLWLKQIVREHSSICQQYGIELSTPIVQLAEASSYWGKWTPAPPMISVSTRLISTEPWDTVKNVLKHEMAHQLVSEQLGGSSGHGVKFQEACRMLGVPEAYRRAGGSLPASSPLDREQNEPGKIIEKLRKIMALAESANEHESLIAIRKARQLMNKHDLSEWSVDKKQCHINSLINLKRKRLATYHKLICSILTGNFNVQIIFAPLYDAHDLTTYKCIDILGRREDVRIAEYVFHFLLTRLPVLWKNHHGSSSGSITDKNSYWLGIINGFREGLGDNPSSRDNNLNNRGKTSSTLPALHNDQALGDFVAERYPKTRNIRGRPGRINPERFEDGRRDGKHLRLAKGVDNGIQAQKKLPRKTGR